MSNSKVKLAHPNMAAYAAFKQVHAVEMCYGEACANHGVRLSEGAVRSDDDAGYLVQYPDGYVSWCPKAQFKSANVVNGDYSIAHAWQLLVTRQAERIWSRSWNGKNLQVMLAVVGIADGAKVADYPCLYAGHDCLGIWTPSLADMFKVDWVAD